MKKIIFGGILTAAIVCGMVFSHAPVQNVAKHTIVDSVPRTML